MPTSPTRLGIRVGSSLIAVALCLYLIITLGMSMKAGTYVWTDIVRIILDGLAFICILAYGVNKYFIGSKIPYFKYAIWIAVAYYLLIGIFDVKEAKGATLNGWFEIGIGISAFAFFKA